MDLSYGDLIVLRYCKMSTNSSSLVFERLGCEKINISFGTFILGVYRKSQNSATRVEFGRIALGMDVGVNIVMCKKP